jgi:hypothetical protein
MSNNTVTRLLPQRGHRKALKHCDPKRSAARPYERLEVEISRRVPLDALAIVTALRVGGRPEAGDLDAPTELVGLAEGLDRYIT